MKIAFIQEFWQEYLGIMYLSAMAKKHGHQVDVFIRGEKNIEKKICGFRPDIIGFSITTGGHLWAFELTKKLKKELKVPVIFGGPHPTICPEIINEKCVDMICIGEGEYALVELLDNLENSKDIKKIKNLWVKEKGKVYKNELRPLVADLNSLPQPDWPLYYKYKFLRDKEIRSFTSSRGCPYSCGFCINPIFQKLFAGKGKYVRQRTVDNLLEEIKTARELYKFDTIQFDDEIFIINKDWLREFLPRFKKEVGIPFFCGVRADMIDEEVVDLLKKHGCYGMSFGIETGNEELRNTVLNKGITNETIIKAARIIKKKGIILRTTNMLALPSEDIDKCLETLQLNIDCNADHPIPYMFHPLPRTKALEYAYKNNYLAKDFSFDNLESMHMDTNPLILKDKKKILNLQKFFYLTVRHPILLPLVKILIKLPPNPLYEAISKLSLVHNYAGYKRMGFLAVLKLGFKTELPKLFHKNLRGAC